MYLNISNLGSNFLFVELNLDFLFWGLSLERNKMVIKKCGDIKWGDTYKHWLPLSPNIHSSRLEWQSYIEGTLIKGLPLFQKKIKAGDVIDEVFGVCIRGWRKGKISALFKQHKGLPVSLNVIKVRCIIGALFNLFICLFFLVQLYYSLINLPHILFNYLRDQEWINFAY